MLHQLVCCTKPGTCLEALGPKGQVLAQQGPQKRLAAVLARNSNHGEAVWQLVRGVSSLQEQQQLVRPPMLAVLTHITPQHMLAALACDGMQIADGRYIMMLLIATW